MIVGLLGVISNRQGHYQWGKSCCFSGEADARYSMRRDPSRGWLSDVVEKDSSAADYGLSIVTRLKGFNSKMESISLKQGGQHCCATMESLIALLFQIQRLYSGPLLY